MSLTNKILGRICSGLLARFRKMPGRLGAADLANMRISFSQHAEDLVILDHLTSMKLSVRGIYIDAGCFDPVLFSNTRLLNLYGWNGLNIDAASDVIQKFTKTRPRDWNVCAALSDDKQTMSLEGPVGAPTRNLSALACPAADKTTLKTTTLRDVVVSSPFASSEVDFLDVDCEGHDFAVLRGFPFDLVRPKLIAIEGHSKAEAETFGKYLADLDYLKVCVRGPTHIFRASETLPPDLRFGALVSEIV